MYAAARILISICCLFAICLFQNPSASPVAASPETKSLRDGPLLAQIFSGLTYSGEYPCPDLQVPPHAFRQLPLPQHLSPDQCYVFHAPAKLDALHKLFIQRLQSEGIDLVRYPKNAKDLVYPVGEGPLFRIDFRKGQWSGSLLALQGQHPDPPPALWRPEDYIFLLTR